MVTEEIGCLCQHVRSYHDASERTQVPFQQFMVRLLELLQSFVFVNNLQINPTRYIQHQQVTVNNAFAPAFYVSEPLLRVDFLYA